MKRVLRDHGQILHAAGHLSMFPVKGSGPKDLGFAHHGGAEGKTALGWGTWFPQFEAAGLVVVWDQDAGELTTIPEEEALKTLGDAAKRPTFLEQVKHALATPKSGTDATNPPAET